MTKYEATREEKVRARHVINNAIRDGRLRRGRCIKHGKECRGKAQFHHRDYSKPLKGFWICHWHHYLEERRVSRRLGGVS